MKKRTSRCNSDTFKQERNSTDDLDNDISLLQRPLRTAHTGFEEARRAYEDGTSEVRRLLTQECSLIYECTLCRNMFRSLANFISHKRVFCCVSAQAVNQYGYTDQNSTTIIQAGNKNGPTPQDIEHMLRSRSTGCSPVPREARSIRGSMRDLSGVIERLRREKEPTSLQRATSTTVLQLEPVPTSNQAVYQTIKCEEADSIKTELNEVHHLLNHEQTVVGPDGKAMTVQQYERQGGSDSGETAEQSVSDETETSISCEKCNLTFQTNKTLEVHIQKHHSSSAFVFQCPACSLTFMQAAAVIRHLSKDHKKPTRRIRMMRNTILKRRVQQGDVQAKGPNRELKRLKLSDDVVDSNVERSDEKGERRKIMSLCIYCEKSFERRAALSTHLLNCRAKQEALAKPAPPVKKMKRKSIESEDTTALNETSVTDATADVKDVASTNMPDLESIERSLERAADAAAETDLNEMFADLAEQNDNFVAGLKTVSLDKLQLHESDASSDDLSNSEDETEPPTTDESKANEGVAGEPVKVKKKRNVPIEKQLRCRCKLCNKQFNALGNLRRHISMFHYRARRFGCSLCEYRAFRRYDIVNHLGFTHKIEGDRQQLTEQYVSTHECQYSRDDVDGDILVMDEVDAAKAVRKLPVKTYEKRLKRNKSTTELPVAKEEAVTSPPKVEPKEEPQECSTSKKRRNQISPEACTRPEKRSIRKRVKAVNKDFVYDHVTFKANTVAPTETPDTETAESTPAADSMRAKLRRHHVSAPVVEETKPKQWDAYISENKKSHVEGITRRLMLELVSQGRAVSATLPELPAERPQIRPRLTSQPRSRNVVDTAAKAGETFLEKIAKRSAAGTKEAATITNLWNKVNTAIAQQQKQETGEAATYQTETLELPQPPVQLELEPRETDRTTPNGRASAEPGSTPPPPPRKCSQTQEQQQAQTPPTAVKPAAKVPQLTLSSFKLPTNALECLNSESTLPAFPALPKPTSVLNATTTANGTIQFTLDSLLRAALQN